VRQPREQIEIRRPEAMLARCTIRDSNDDPRVGGRRLAIQQHRSEAMLIYATSNRYAAFEICKRRGEKLGLTKQPLGAAIGFRDRTEFRRQQPMEIVDALEVPPQVVVEAHDFDDQARPQSERRTRASLFRRSGGEPKQHFSLEVRQQSGGHTRRETLIEIGPREKLGFAFYVPEHPPKLDSRAPRRKQDGGRTIGLR
jgi:hypothetical protein